MVGVCHMRRLCRRRVAKLATPTGRVQFTKCWLKIDTGGGYDAAPTGAVEAGGLRRPGDGRWEQSLPQKISFKKMESPVIFSQENSPTNSAAETGSRTSMIPAA